jgi:PTS system nitrogen regulatory IIA component
MNLAAMLNEKLIFVDVPGRDRKGIYGEILKRAAVELPPLPLEKLIGEMIAYEDAHCIAAADVAMPHLRLPQIKALHVIVAVLREPVMLHDYDSRPCRIVIMSLLSSSTSDVYLKTLSSLVRFLGRSVNREALFAAKDASDVIAAVQQGDVEVKKIITALDVMRPAKFTLRPEDHLSVAWDIFLSEFAPILPVVDRDGVLLGEISALDVIRRFIPKHMTVMKDVSVLGSAEPFSRMFHEENTQQVRDYMLPAAIVVSGDTPLAQFTIRMAQESILAAFVIDEERRLLGIITIRNIVRLMLRS